MNRESLAKQLIDSGKASPELIAAYSSVKNGEYAGVIQAHRKTVKRAQTRERVRKYRANKKMESVK